MQVLALRPVVLIAAALMPWAAGAAVTPESVPLPPLTAEQIVERNAQARGGLETWRGIRNMVWTGQMEGPSTDLPAMQFLLMQSRPNKTRFEVNAMGEHSLRVFDGSNGWKELPGRGNSPEPQPFTPQELKFAQNEVAIDGPLIDSAARGSKVRLGGVEQEDGHRAYRLDVTTSSGNQEEAWVDVQTFLDLRYDRTSWTSAGKPVNVTVRYHDYKDFGGVKIPTKLDIGGTGESPASRMLVEHVDINGELDPRAFVSPFAGRHHAGKATHSPRGGPGLGEALPAWAMRQAGVSAAKRPSAPTPAAAAPASATAAAVDPGATTADGITR